MKAPIHDLFLVDWSMKSLFPTIAKDVLMEGGIMEEQTICCTQHVDVIYSQLGTLYDIIPNAPFPSNDVA